MTTVTTWDPFRELTALRGEVGRVLGAARQSTRTAGAWAPPVDVYETADDILVTVDLPGVTADAVDVELDDHVLAIRGERRFQEPEGEGRFHHSERSYGRFARTVTLPPDVRDDDITATFTDGVLTVRVPKAEEVTPRKIAVNAESPAAEAEDATTDER